MATRLVLVSLEATGVAALTAAGTLRDFTAVDRVKRAALVMLGAVLLAATLIPIPIIHLLGIPLVLLGGILMAGRQLASVARLQPLRVACPKCGSLNRLGGGLGYRSVTGALDRTCDSCRRNLTMRITDR